jgi:hypothetical protein
MKENKITPFEFLDNLPDKCANLIIDPPYYKVKGDFDFIWRKHLKIICKKLKNGQRNVKDF